jgi:hypothetical protein
VKVVRVTGLAVALVLALGGLAAAPATSAGPAVRWASPTGTGTDCTEASPCPLTTALIGAATNDGDEVIIKPGDYNITGVQVEDAIDVHGQAGQPRPTINTNSNYGFRVVAAAHVHDLNVTSSFSQYVLASDAPPPGSATFERVSVRSSTASSFACLLSTSTLMRDSICSQSAIGTAIGSNLGGAVETEHIVLRNVTAVSLGSAIEFRSNTPTNFAIDAQNVIADGGSDIRAFATDAADHNSVTIELRHSNFDSVQAGTTPDTTSTITAPGSGTNQTDPPLFVNDATGDFHEAAGSPTIDAGALDAQTGATDIDGDPRSLRGTTAASSCPVKPDIGADELNASLTCDAAPPPPAASAPSAPAAPDTTITKGPKKILAHGKKARVKVTFSSSTPGTFECALDDRVFAACASPFKKKVKLGKHRLQVRAVSTTGVVDPTPAVVTFKVKARSDG